MAKKKKNVRQIEDVRHDLSLDEAEILTRGQRSYQDIRDWLRVLYAAGYHVTRSHRC